MEPAAPRSSPEVDEAKKGGQHQEPFMIAQEAGRSSEQAEAAEADRLLRNKLFGGAAGGLNILGIAGFCQAFYVYLTSNEWYFDAVGRQNYPGTIVAKEMFGLFWHLLLDFHALTAITWTILAFFQVVTGATGQPGDARKGWHRTIGRWAAAIGVLVAVQAMILQLLKPRSVQDVEIFTNAVAILMNLAVGIRYARTGNFKDHKLAMAFSSMWTAAPGMVRFTFYVLKLSWGGDCRVEQMGFYSWGPAVLGLVIIIPTALVLGEHKSTVVIGNICAILLAMCGSFLEARNTMAEGDWCWQ